MHQSSIITTFSSNATDRIQLVQTISKITLRTNNPDILILDDKNPGIAQSRLTAKFLSTLPSVNTYKVVHIVFAENLSLQAQNALLKTLEEPPSFAQIYLTTNSVEKLLPTVTSRCHQTNQQTPPPTPTSDDSWDNQASPGQRLIMANKHNTNRDTAQDFINQTILNLRDNLLKNPTNTSLYNLTLALYSNRLLESNVNVKLTLDHFFLNKR